MLPHTIVTLEVVMGGAVVPTRTANEADTFTCHLSGHSIPASIIQTSHYDTYLNIIISDYNTQYNVMHWQWNRLHMLDIL